MNSVCPYPDIFLFAISAAEEIDSRPQNQPTVTKRMKKKAEELLNPTKPRVPHFLEGCSQGGKRSRNAGGDMRTPFIPPWGICEQDSIFGSPHLALDWSKLSITPPDRVTLHAGDRMDESQLMGAQALYQV